jgi:hypothetical protein
VKGDLEYTGCAGYRSNINRGERTRQSTQEDYKETTDTKDTLQGEEE